MAPSQEPPRSDSDPTSTWILEAGPTTYSAPAHPEPMSDVRSAPSARPRASARVAIVEGSVGGTLTGEIGSLRRERLGAASGFLTAAYTILLAWAILTHGGAVHRVIWASTIARLALAGVVAALVSRRVPMSTRRLRWAEYGLFGGLTAILVASQFFLNRDYLLAGHVAESVAYMKNGVIQMFALMVLYGMFIPNHPRASAAVVLTMALAPLISMALLMGQGDLAPALRQLRTIEHGGSNFLFLMVGAAMATYGSYVLHGLRAELHDARKFGQYRLLKRIAVGGMGEVYLAEHQLLKRPCALKLIKPEAGSNPVTQARFEREVRAAARLSHPNSIEIYDYGHAQDGTFYYVMEYLPGLSLEELVREAGPLPPGRAIYLLRQACSGLAEAHGIGLVHRDLKPANVFVARRGGESDVAKVLDFGLVKLTLEPEAPALTGELIVSGTPSYMAPEQASASRDLDARADVYSMGAVAYFALTGQPPFLGESAFAIMMAHARDAVVPPSHVRPSIPADLEKVVLTALAKKPDDRYPDARSMGRALAACQSARNWDADKADHWWAEADRKAHARPRPTA